MLLSAFIFTIFISGPLASQTGDSDTQVLSDSPSAEEMQTKKDTVKFEPEKKEAETKKKKAVVKRTRAEKIEKNVERVNVADAAESVKETDDSKTAEKQKNTETTSGVDNVEGLLFLNDENISIKRIPGIKVNEAVQNSDDDIIKIQDNYNKKKKEQKGSVFGLGKEETSTVAKWAIVIFAFLLFILYRATHTRVRNKRVVRLINRK